MATYQKDLSGSFTLEELNNEVRTEEESQFSWFQSSKPVKGNNRITFRGDDDRPMPSTNQLIIAESAPPAGLNHFWTGPMVVSRTTRQVEAYK